MCLDLLCCCLGPAACGLCCGGCGGKAKSSILTRLMYLTFLVGIVLVSAILLAPEVQKKLENTDILCKDYNRSLGTPDISVWVVRIPLPDPSISQDALLNCGQFIGYLAVYRICMAVASFFFVMMLIMLCVFSSKDPRSYIQNGFWCIKWLVVIAITIAFFFIPDGQNFVFSKISVVLAMIASIIFIIIQVILLVDLAHRMAEFLLDKAEESDNKWWYLPMLVITIIIDFCTLVGIVLMYVFFTELSSCSLNKFFITSTLFLSVAVSIVAILPWIQRVQPKSGLLQAAVVSGYCTYLTWSAISTEPYGDDRDCRIRNSEFAVFSDNHNALAASIIGIFVLLVTVAYICFSLSSKRQLKKFRGDSKEENEGSLLCCDCLPGESEDDTTSGDDEGEEKGKWRLSNVDDEKEQVTYSYSFFHFLMLLSVLYLMMQLTNWGYPGEADSEHFQNTWASVWVKMATVWLCFGVYVWTLVAPIVLGRCRDFEYVQE